MRGHEKQLRNRRKHLRRVFEEVCSSFELEQVSSTGDFFKVMIDVFEENCWYVRRQRYAGIHRKALIIEHSIC